MPNQANIDRFTGFSRLYDQSRPAPPRVLLEVIMSYATSKPKLVADIGCGSGLSTFPWTGYADRVIGIDPNPDFLDYARTKARRPRHVEFREGHGSQTGLPDASVDIVTCSQSFHWMEPQTSLAEFARVLAPGGILAIYDCEWPLVMGWELEVLHRDLIAKANDVYARENKGEVVEHQDKTKYAALVKRSGQFAYTREVFLHVKKRIGADAIIGVALSQGGVQTALRRWEAEFMPAVEAYERKVRALVKGKRGVIYSYDLIIGIKGD